MARRTPPTRALGVGDRCPDPRRARDDRRARRVRGSATERHRRAAPPAQPDQRPRLGRVHRELLVRRRQRREVHLHDGGYQLDGATVVSPKIDPPPRNSAYCSLT